MRFATVFVASAVAAVCALPALLRAETAEIPTHYSGGLGFHDVVAPLGGRWWLAGQKIGIDFGLGFGATPAPSYDENLNSWAFEVGVPIVLKNWDKVHVLFRPGFLYESQEVQMSNPPNPFATDDTKSFSLTAEIEAEIFIVDNFSVSASEGIGFFNVDPAGGGDSSSSFGTLGNNFSHIGFHVYFFGGKSN
jgi:hypothetical protein